MNITTIIIVTTFLIALIEKLSKSQDQERNGILNKLKLGNITIILLAILLLAQIRENNINATKEIANQTKSNETHQDIITTKEKVDEANKVIDEVLLNIQNEIEFTREEFRLISYLNKEMTEARKSVSISLDEYRQLNSNYTMQLELERDKVKSSKPDVRIILPKSTKDSLHTSYQYQLLNSGQRVADSVLFYSVMLLTDSSYSIFNKISELKTNSGVHNILSLPPDQGYTHYANSVIFSNEEIENFSSGFLLIKYRFYDLMTNSTTASPLLTFRCPSFKETNIQYGNNVDTKIVNKIKRYLELDKPELYKIFFEE